MEVQQDIPQQQEDPVFGPKGRWKHGIFDCFDVLLCTPLCCMTSCCNTIVVAQIMTRLGLDWCGMPNPTNAAGTFSMVVLLYFAFLAAMVALVGVVFLPVFVCYIIVIFTRSRYYLRRQFEIPTEYCHSCDGVMEDCCCQIFCCCCSTIQMARHTHDEVRYPYQYDQPNGLPPDAPQLYEPM
jgi:Cys-rich protein (TIGR01571 family)